MSTNHQYFIEKQTTIFRDFLLRTMLYVFDFYFSYMNCKPKDIMVAYRFSEIVNVEMDLYKHKMIQENCTKVCTIALFSTVLY